VNNFADLGPEAVRTVATRTVASREADYAAAAARTGATLTIYDTNIGGLHDSASRFREVLLTAIGTGNGNGVSAELESLFGQTRSTLNAREGGRLMFAGTATESPPFTPASLGELAALPSADAALANDTGRVSVRLSDGHSLEYGLLADETGRNVVEAMRKVAGAGIPNGRMDDAQRAALTDALTALDAGLGDLRSVQARNGSRQGNVERAGTDARDRNTLLTKIVSDVEDADYAQIAASLIATQTALKASYSVFAQMREMSLTNYLS
jgi:flagellar hook-associated protein 3 FlgL